MVETLSPTRLRSLLSLMLSRCRSNSYHKRPMGECSWVGREAVLSVIYECLVIRVQVLIKSVVHPRKCNGLDSPNGGENFDENDIHTVPLWTKEPSVSDRKQLKGLH
jgi:hypothetical protein